MQQGLRARRGGRKLQQLGHVLLTAVLALTPLASQAGDLNLANAPLFLGSAVEPNIVFANDDSGSMDWGILVVGGLEGKFTIQGQDTTGPYVFVMCQRVSSTNNSCTSGKWDNHRDWNSNSGRILPSEEAVIAAFGSDPYGVWRARFSGYNAMYYNPEVVYAPWAGVDEAGTVYADVNPAAAPVDPFLAPSNPSRVEANLTVDMDWGSLQVPRPTSSGAQDITVTGYHPARYYLWTDSDADGVVDPDDAHTRIEIKPGNAPFIHTSGNRTDCANPLSCTYTEEIQNFANWFSYYHRREFAAKNAIGNFTSGATNLRLAYASLHNNSGANNIAIASMNADPQTGNKRAVLDALYKTQSSGGTPLRTMLDQVGRYYECETGNLFGASGSSCPILPAPSGECQQNFTVLMTDGFWNGTAPTVGNTDGPDPGNTPFDGDPYADDQSNTLADVAMHYYERDLSSLADKVPVTSGIDEAAHQHMVTFTVAFGLEGTLDPFDTKTPGDPTDTDPKDAGFVGWPTPVKNDPTTLDDMWHAAYNARGQFLSANNPTDLNKKLNEALRSIVDRTSSAAAVALNSGTLTTTSKLYQARFDSGEWSGQLLAIPINANGSLGSTLWDAGVELANQATREIVTWNPEATPNPTGVPFQWADIGPSQRLELDTDGQGAARLDYLRGDHSNEELFGGSFRDRLNSYVLGDIVSSSPVFVGAPPFAFPDSLDPGYQAFQGANSGRTEMVYVGANDGMLHGFDAATGEEKIAYVPGGIYARLSALTNPGYTHRYYVDGTPTVSDVFFGGDWHTVLVGTLRGGGQGLFALDVTDPGAFSQTNAASLVLWEFTDANDRDLGYTFSRPAIAKMRNGKWAAVFGNGYNNTENDGGATTSTSGNAVLYIAFIEDGLDGTWTVNTDFIKIDTGKGKASSADGTTPNGLATPAIVDQEGDFIADLIVAGDLQGNMWKFDVSNVDPTKWDVVRDVNGDPVPLFTATDASVPPKPQPITVRPEVSDHPDGLDGFMVYFGTGKFIETGDNATTGAQVQTFYGIWDEMGTTTGAHSTVNKANLRTQTITETTASGRNVRTITDDPIDAWGTDANEFMGWRVDLPAIAEKQVTNPVLIGERVLFTTLIPDDTPCGFGGTGFVMELDFQNGGPPDVSVFDVNQDGVIDANDLVNNLVVVGIDPGIGTLPDPAIIHPGAESGPDQPMLKIFSGSSGEVESVANPRVTVPFRRRSWRQLR